MKKKIIFFLTIMFLYFFLKEIFIFIFPGFALIIFFSKKINAKYVIYSIGLSLSFWIISFWFLKYIPLPLDIFIYLIIIISIIFLGTKIETLSFKKKEKYILLIFILIILLRLIPYFLNYFPAGADMSFHTLTTKIITEKNGFPSDYMPILPFKIGNYPLGFHIISACISIFSNIEEYRATLLLANFSYAFLGFCLYVFLTNYFKPKTSLICSIIATFGTNNPQFFIGWGGNSVVLSICFLFLGASLVENIFKLNFKDVSMIFTATREEFFSHYTIELISPNGRLRYDRGGKLVIWQDRSSNAQGNQAKVLLNNETVIKSNLSKYQKNVVNQLNMVIKGQDSYLCTGEQALELSKDIFSIIKKIKYV